MIIRPNHTELNVWNKPRLHLLHPGSEVLEIFNQQLLTVIVGSLCGDVLEWWGTDGKGFVAPFGGGVGGEMEGKMQTK